MCLGSSLYFFGKAPLQYPHTRFHVLVFGLTVFWNGRKVSWLRRFLWWTNWSNKCGQTMAIMYEHMKRIQECWVQQHKAFFCAQSVASIRLTVWKWSGESRHPGPFRTRLKTFVAPFLPTRLTAPGSPRMAKWNVSKLGERLHDEFQRGLPSCGFSHQFATSFSKAWKMKCSTIFVTEENTRDKEIYFCVLKKGNYWYSFRTLIVD